MSQFPPAYSYVMQWEDPTYSYAETTDNNGAGVISGINAKSWPSDFAYVASVSQSQRGPAIANFYQNRYWIPMQVGGLQSQDLANRVVDAGVNMGAGIAAQLLQEAINTLHPGSVTVDGGIGPLTLEEANACDGDAILAAFRQVRGNHYRAIVAAKPQYQVYMSEWLKRAEA